MEHIATLPYGTVTLSSPLKSSLLSRLIPWKTVGMHAPSYWYARPRGSNVYEVNPWLWQFGRGKPRLGGLTVEDTTERKNAARDERLERLCRNLKAD